VTERRRLPNRRASTTLSYVWKDLGFTTTLASARSPGRVVELFIGNGKTGTIDLIAKDFAIACSIGLQAGADFETIRRGLLRDSQNAPTSPLGAAMDAIAIALLDGVAP
jgi:hypothetical protein